LSAVLLAGLVAAAAASSAAVASSSRAAVVHPQGAAGTVSPIAHRSTLFPSSGTNSSRPHGPYAGLRFRSSGGSFPALRATGRLAPLPGGGLVSQPSNPGVVNWLRHGFNSLSDREQSLLNFGDPASGDLTPPDQGLCAGFVGEHVVVLAVVNDAIIETTTTGQVLGVASLASFFDDPFVFSDPRCFYDPATSTFFFTVVSCVTCVDDSYDDLAVVNSNGFSLYQFSSNKGGTEYGDQPKAGFDANAFYISTDQFPPSGPGYFGAQLLAISKPDLVAQTTSVAFKQWDDLAASNGIPVTTLQPAFYGRTGDAGGTEYLLNSFPYDAAGDNLLTSDQIDLWKVTGDANLDGNQSLVVLTDHLLSSETYAFPIPAASTGNGSISLVNVGSDVVPVESEPFLDPGDDRMQQVQMTTDGGSPVLYASLPTAIAGTPTVDGAAYFVIDPVGLSISQQGYTAVNGRNMLYPAIYHEGESSGNTALVFTLTSPRLSPSAAVEWFGPGFTSPQVAVVAEGTGPHLSFSDLLEPPFDQPRWGDYSAAVLDPKGNGMWLATERIPGRPDQAPLDNWGTWVQPTK
jgi:hypothetical protein